MTASMNEPANDESDTPPDATWIGYGAYVVPTQTDLTRQGVTSAATGFAPPRQQLGEDDYAPDRFASGADVDKHRYLGQYHPESYGETGPKPYPA